MNWWEYICIFFDEISDSKLRKSTENGKNWWRWVERGAEIENISQPLKIKTNKQFTPISSFAPAPLFRIKKKNIKPQIGFPIRNWQIEGGGIETNKK